MMIEMDGEKHFEMFVSEKELAVIKAMRKGATASLYFDGLTEIEEVDEHMDLFEQFESDGFSRIYQKTGSRGNQYICFSKEMDNIEVTCFLDI